jgi:hypothetical protein
MSFLTITKEMSVHKSKQRYEENKQQLEENNKIKVDKLERLNNNVERLAKTYHSQIINLIKKRSSQGYFDAYFNLPIDDFRFEDYKPNHICRLMCNKLSEKDKPLHGFIFDVWNNKKFTTYVKWSN